MEEILCYHLNRELKELKLTKFARENLMPFFKQFDWLLKNV